MAISGAGWINAESYGLWRKDIYSDYASFKEIRSPEKMIFKRSVKNFGRFDLSSKFACVSVALALNDAGIVCGQDQGMDIGLVGTNQEGAVAANVAYFKDFVDCGRTMGRGNLFIYTLPSSPLAEVSIHFGLRGPLLYATGDMLDMIQTCCLLIADSQAERMMLIHYTEKGSFSCLLDGELSSSISDLDSIKKVAHIACLL